MRDCWSVSWVVVVVGGGPWCGCGCGVIYPLSSLLSHHPVGLWHNTTGDGVERYLPKVFEMGRRLVFPQSLDYQPDGCELQSANDDKGNSKGFEDEDHCEEKAGRFGGKT